MSSISDQAQLVKSAFARLSRVVSFQEFPISASRDLQDEHEHFILCAVNLGVFDSGHTSLDYRLQDVPEAITLVNDYLTDLKDHLEPLLLLNTTSEEETAERNDQSHEELATTTGQLGSVSFSGSESESDSEEQDLDETSARVLSIRDIVHRLFRLARSIRNPNTRSAQGRRNIYSLYPKDDRPAIVDLLISIERLRITDFLIQLRKQDYDGHVDSEEEIDLTEEDNILIDRLAKACSRRRQQFVYWRARHERSIAAATTSDYMEEMHEEIQSLPQDVQNAALVSADRPERPESVPSSVTRIRREQIDLVERRSAASDISRAPSARGPSGQKPGWPSLPDGLQEGSHFECPFCFCLCPDRYRSEAGWKAHLIHDLKPYCCTYSTCDSGDQLYESWADWTTHEMLVHNRVWTCLEHPDAEFGDLAAYRNHVQISHAAEADLMLTPELENSRTAGSRWSNRPCPFCLADIPNAGELHHHVAWHLETAALISLPRSTGCEQGSEEQDLRSDAQKADDIDSRLDDVNDMPLPEDNQDRPAEQTVLGDEQTMTELTSRITRQVMETLRKDGWNSEKAAGGQAAPDIGSGGEQSSSAESTEPQVKEQQVHPTLWIDAGALGRSMDEVILAIADHLIEDFEPKNSIVISANKMQDFYARHPVHSDKLPWASIMDDRTSSLSRLWRSLEVEHHLTQEGLSLKDRPDMPALTPRGFATWMRLVFQTQPGTEGLRVSRILETEEGVNSRLRRVLPGPQWEMVLELLSRSEPDNSMTRRILGLIRDHCPGIAVEHNVFDLLKAQSRIQPRTEPKPHVAKPSTSREPIIHTRQSPRKRVP